LRKRQVDARLRQWTRSAVARLRQSAVPAGEAVLAASLAWFVATTVAGHPDPVFAPSAALVVLAESRGRRLRQSAEIVLGVSAGVLVADVVVEALGSGSVAIAVVLLLTVGPMIALGASSTLVVQAAISAIYLVAVPAPKTSLMQLRFVDALVGGAIALVISQVAVARSPLGRLVAEARQTFADLAGLLDAIDQAVVDGDEQSAHTVLRRARELNGCVEKLQAEVSAAGETLRLRVRRRELGQLAEVQATAVHLDHVVDNIWVLARNAVTVTRLRVATPPEVSDALRELAEAVREAGEALATDLVGSGDPDRHAARADHAALQAVRIAAKLLEDEPQLPLVMIIGQIRVTAVDLLRGVGQDDQEVLERVDEALGLHAS
jgi:uncharacterized membrane protein YgaE (UPF0421/DUF939 family)